MNKADIEKAIENARSTEVVGIDVQLDPLDVLAAIAKMPHLSDVVVVARHGTGENVVHTLYSSACGFTAVEECAQELSDFVASVTG